MVWQEECEAAGALAVVLLDESYSPSAEVQAFRQTDDETPIKRSADIIVEGRFDPNATPGCFAPRYGIIATNIEIVSPVTVEVLPERE